MTKTILQYHQKRQVEEVLKTLLTAPDERGYVAYKDQSMTDEKVAAGMPFACSSSNVAGVRKMVFGSMKPLAKSQGKTSEKLEQVNADVGEAFAQINAIINLLKTETRRIDGITDELNRLLDRVKRLEEKASTHV